MLALRSSLLEVLPKETELLPHQWPLFSNTTPKLLSATRAGNRKKKRAQSSDRQRPNAGYIWIQTAGGPRLPVTNEIMMKITAITINT